MKQIALHFDLDVTIVEVPELIADNIEYYRKLFDNWISDKSNNHGHWYIVNGEKKGVFCDSQTVIDFWNQIVLKKSKEKVRVLKKQKYGDAIPCEMPILYF